MTLLEIASLAAARFGLSDPATLAQARALAAARYRMIWDDQLWRDSLCSFAFTLDPAAPGRSLAANPLMAARGIVLLPSSVARVVALRRASGEVPFCDEQQLFQCDPDGFAARGAPAQFQILPPCCGFNPDPDLPLSVTSDPADDGAAVTVAWFTDQCRRRVQSFPLSAGAPPALCLPGLPDIAAQILFMNAPAATHAVCLASGGRTIAAIPPGEGALEKRLGLRVLPVPAGPEAFRALVKVQALPLLDDQSETQLRGCDNALAAFVLADLLQRDRQYSKAQAVTQEAVALLEQLKRQETLQDAFRARLVPGGAGEDSLDADPLP